ncbi:hypothetical protein [Streptomyces sp. WM6378]|uniref:hypothetical protein n=1 Tax=Streptomyces sp. WM6378 TaxID=1415557 RepID=UPI000A4F1345|nr:hypothetical protein [Streptomyces sp. WM6378]
MVSLPEELEAREAAARRRVEELQAEAAELALRMEKAREDLSRLEITRETVTKVLAELSAADMDVELDVSAEPERESEPHGAAVMMVPPWREGLVTTVLPDVYRDIMEVIADAPGPLQAKQIVPRIGLPATTDRGHEGEAQASGGAGVAGRGRAGTVRPGTSRSGHRPAQLPVTKGLFSVAL